MIVNLLLSYNSSKNICFAKECLIFIKYILMKITINVPKIDDCQISMNEFFMKKLIKNGILECITLSDKFEIDEIDSKNLKIDTRQNLSFDFDYTRYSKVSRGRVYTLLKDIEGEMKNKKLDNWDLTVLSALQVLQNSKKHFEYQKLKEFDSLQLFCCWCCIFYYLDKQNTEDLPQDALYDRSIYQDIQNNMKIELMERNA